jgi:hypothetical protein
VLEPTPIISNCRHAHFNTTKMNGIPFYAGSVRYHMIITLNNFDTCVMANTLLVGGTVKKLGVQAAEAPNTCVSAIVL